MPMLLQTYAIGIVSIHEQILDLDGKVTARLPSIKPFPLYSLQYFESERSWEIALTTDYQCLRIPTPKSSR